MLHHTWRMARPGRVRVAFGRPLRLRGEDYEALAKEVENAVRALEACLVLTKLVLLERRVRFRVTVWDG